MFGFDKARPAPPVAGRASHTPGARGSSWPPLALPAAVLTLIACSESTDNPGPRPGGHEIPADALEPPQPPGLNEAPDDALLLEGFPAFGGTAGPAGIDFQRFSFEGQPLESWLAQPAENVSLEALLVDGLPGTARRLGAISLSGDGVLLNGLTVEGLLLAKASIGQVAMRNVRYQGARLTDANEEIVSTAMAVLAECALGDSQVASIERKNGDVQSVEGVEGIAPTWHEQPLDILKGPELAGCVERRAVGWGLDVAYTDWVRSALELLVKYVARCALAPGEYLLHGVRVTGGLALAPGWLEEGMAAEQIGRVSLCLGALTNTQGRSVQVQLRNPTWLPNADSAMARVFAFHEGAFYGNVFSSEPELGFCAASLGSSNGRSDRSLTSPFSYTARCDSLKGRLPGPNGYDTTLQGLRNTAGQGAALNSYVSWRPSDFALVGDTGFRCQKTTGYIYPTNSSLLIDYTYGDTVCWQDVTLRDEPADRPPMLSNASLSAIASLDAKDASTRFGRCTGDSCTFFGKENNYVLRSGTSAVELEAFTNASWVAPGAGAGTRLVERLGFAAVDTAGRALGLDGETVRFRDSERIAKISYAGPFDDVCVTTVGGASYCTDALHPDEDKRVVDIESAPKREGTVVSDMAHCPGFGRLCHLVNGEIQCDDGVVREQEMAFDRLSCSRNSARLCAWSVSRSAVHCWEAARAKASLRLQGVYAMDDGEDSSETCVQFFPTRHISCVGPDTVDRRSMVVDPISYGLTSEFASVSLAIMSGVDESERPIIDALSDGDRATSITLRAGESFDFTYHRHAFADLQVWGLGPEGVTGELRIEYYHPSGQTDVRLRATETPRPGASGKHLRNYPGQTNAFTAGPTTTVRVTALTDVTMAEMNLRNAGDISGRPIYGMQPADLVGVYVDNDPSVEREIEITMDDEGTLFLVEGDESRRLYFDDVALVTVEAEPRQVLLMGATFNLVYDSSRFYPRRLR